MLTEKLEAAKTLCQSITHMRLVLLFSLPYVDLALKIPKQLDMIYDLVLHLLKFVLIVLLGEATDRVLHRQGCYNSSKNIVILAAYLGQIPKIRKKLQDVVTTVVDERDAELLEQHGLEEDETPTVRQVQASSRVLIRLVFGA